MGIGRAAGFLKESGGLVGTEFSDDLDLPAAADVSPDASALSADAGATPEGTDAGSAYLAGAENDDLLLGGDAGNYLGGEPADALVPETAASDASSAGASGGIAADLAAGADSAPDIVGAILEGSAELVFSADGTGLGGADGFDMLAGADAGALDALSQEAPEAGAGSAPGNHGASLSLTSMPAMPWHRRHGRGSPAGSACQLVHACLGTPTGLFGFDQGDMQPSASSTALQTPS